MQIENFNSEKETIGFKIPNPVITKSENSNSEQNTFDFKNPNPVISLNGKPNYLKLAVDCDFFNLFSVIATEYDSCFLFESLGEESNVSRHFIIGFDPVKIFTATDATSLCIEDTKSGNKITIKTANPYNELRKHVPNNIISRKYAGGLVGYIGYDAINFFEPQLEILSSDKFEAFKFGVYLDGLIYDQVTGEVFYFYYDENRFNEVKKHLHSKPKPYGSLEVEFLGNSMNKKQHAETVAKVKEDIVSGRIFQCEVGFRSLYKIKGDTLPIYAKLRELNPSPHMYYLKFGEQKIIGASPELLFRLRNGEMETFPLAGTAKRGKDSSEDIRLARKMLNDPKEIAEHNMLVDLHRNDLGRVARFGTVKVRSLMDVKRYSHVQHISSEIVGIMAEGEDMFSALASNFPAGTLTGAPKLEAMKIINELESVGRGPYGGAIGQFSFNGDCAFAIPIRTVFINGENAYVQTCGGNVYDSTADDEYREIGRKLTAMQTVLMHFCRN